MEPKNTYNRYLMRHISSLATHSITWSLWQTYGVPLLTLLTSYRARNLPTNKSYQKQVHKKEKKSKNNKNPQKI